MENRLFALVTLVFLFLAIDHARAAVSAPMPRKKTLIQRLSAIRSRVISTEAELIDALKTQKQARDNIRKIQVLMRLQKEETELGQKRIQELEDTVGELEARRGVLRERILVQQRSMRRSLADILGSMNEQPRTNRLAEREPVEAPRRKVLSHLVNRGIRELEALRIDLADADTLEARISEEREQLAYLFQNMKEQESVLELNRQLQSDLIQKKHAERLAQLEAYRKLKSAEGQVETLISQFNARIELERVEQSERAVSRAMRSGFARLKGGLPMPVAGSIVSAFGRTFDPKSRLHVFKKGIEIAAGKKLPVLAIAPGKTAFSGELPGYGRVTIVDHGDHFYSLCANLGELARKTGDSVAAGDPIGLTDESGTPVYFEIRSRNVAVNPLQWISN